jgi:hypothetical protein
MAGGVQATDTGDDLTRGAFTTGASGIGSELGSTGDVGLSDDFTSSDTTAVRTDDILADEGDLEAGRER